MRDYSRFSPAQWRDLDEQLEHQAKALWSFWIEEDGDFLPLTQGVCPYCKVGVWRYWRNPPSEHVHQDDECGYILPFQTEPKTYREMNPDA
jgi:hypothetical protein